MPNEPGSSPPGPVPAARAKGRDVTPDAALDVARLTPSPPVAAPEAAEAVRAHFGLTGELARLPGEADDNFLLQASGGGQRYVVKFAHLRADPAVVGVQVRVLQHIESVAAGLPVPRVLPAAGGQPWTVVADGPLRGRVVHVLTYLDGELLRSVRTDPALRRTLGVTLARLGRALREFDDPLVRRPLLWDLAQLPQLRPLLPKTSGPARRAARPARGRPAAAAGHPENPARAQRLQPGQHADLGRRPPGVRDHRLRRRDRDRAGQRRRHRRRLPAQRRADLLAPALDLIAGYHATTPLTAAELIGDVGGCGYHATTPLTAGELDLLPDLILARIVARIIISEWRAERFRENRAYVLRNTPRAWEHLHRWLSIPAEQIAARISGGEPCVTPRPWSTASTCLPSTPSIPNCAGSSSGGRACSARRTSCSTGTRCGSSAPRACTCSTPDGQAYLDAYNNVPSVGHCHPRVTEAIARQAATLNTHTRYASELILDYAERLLGTYPAELGNVMFTCTGSEAVDLALRIARFRTGGEGTIITANAYHGVTTAAAEISPSLGPAVPLGRAVWTVAPPAAQESVNSLAERVRAIRSPTPTGTGSSSPPSSRTACSPPTGSSPTRRDA